MNTRGILIAAGIIAFAIGTAEMTGIRIVPLSIDRTIVLLVGVLPLLQAYRVIQARRVGDVREAVTPDPEFRPEIPPPGADFEETLGRITGNRHRVTHSGTRVRDALRSVAATVLTRYGPYSQDEAQAAIDDGTWTDNPVAARFLGDDVPPPPLRNRIWFAVRGGSAFSRGIRESVEAIATAAGLATPEPSGSFDPLAWAFGRQTDDPERRESTTVPRDSGETRGDRDRSHDPIRRVTQYWRGIGALALVSLGVGILFQAPAVVLTGIIGLAFGAVAQYTTTPAVELSIDRALSTDTPKPGADIDVTVTVGNTGSTVLWDLRIVDGVPPGLPVADGSPRLGTALRPGESIDYSYSLTAHRGRHEFEPTLVIARSLSNTVELESFVSNATTIDCIPPLQATRGPPPLRAEATRYAGQVATRTGGEGIEFHATRAYRAGDPLSRIDWNRWARTGEFATVEFREERAASVVLLIDARPPAYVRPHADGDHAVDRTVEAASGLFATLLDDGHQVGIAGLGAGDCWISPGAGREHRTRVQKLLALHPALRPEPPTTYPHIGRVTNRLRRQLDSGTQIIAFTPLTDGIIGRVIGELDARGYPVTVVAPDATVAGTPGQRLAQIGRRLRMSELRSAGIPVVDWPWTEPIDTALVRHAEGGPH